MKKKIKHKRPPKGWRRVRIGEKSKLGDWLEPVFEGPWWKLLKKYCGRPTEKIMRVIIRRTTSRKRSPNSP